MAGTEVYDPEGDGESGLAKKEVGLAKKEEKRLRGLAGKIKEEDQVLDDLAAQLGKAKQKEEEMLELKDEALKLIREYESVEGEEKKGVQEMKQLIERLHENAMSDQGLDSTGKLPEEQRKLYGRILNDAKEVKKDLEKEESDLDRLVEILEKLMRLNEQDEKLFAKLEELDEKVEEEDEEELMDINQLIDDLKNNGPL